ncbi:MAG TPA: hypothetical protein VGN59_13325 [Acidimicrobiia bacterium]|jgi:transposase
MSDTGCPECGTTLVVAAPLDSLRRPRPRRVAVPSELLQCPGCGSTWERDLAGVTTRRSPSRPEVP